MGRTQHHTKAQIVVAVVWAIAVAVGTARVVTVVVPRAAAHDLSKPPGRVLPPGAGMIVRLAGGAARGGGRLPRTPSRGQSAPSCRGPRGQCSGWREDRGRTQHHTKAQNVAAEVWAKAAAEGTAREVTVEVPRAAAHDPTNIVDRRRIVTPLVARFIRVLECGVPQVNAPQTGRPFPDIAAHVFTAVGAGAGRVTTGCAGFTDGLLRIGALGDVVVVTPGIAARRLGYRRPHR